MRPDLQHGRGLCRRSGRASRHAEAVAHPTLGPISLIAQPIAMSRSRGTIDSAAPERGEHTDAILHELGYGATEIEVLRASHAV